MNVNFTSLLSPFTALFTVLLYSTHCSTLLFSVTSPLQFCRSQNKTDLECYYEPLSKCTIHDALAGADGKQMEIDSITHVGDIIRGEEDTYMQNYISKKHNLFCCHHEIMIISCFSLLIVASCYRFFYYAAISWKLFWLFEPLCASVLSQVLTRLSTRTHLSFT